MATPITVALVEDAVVYRKKLESLINATADLRCLCVCETVAAALARLPALAPQVVLMDLQLPDGSGTDCTFQLKTLLPETQFMILTVHEDSEEIFKALKLGASGYLLKRTSPTEILASIRDLHAGGAPMSSEIARKVVQYFHKTTAKPVAAAPHVQGLSPRQEEILRYLAQGYIAKEIADKMNLSVETVRSYLKLVYQKLHVRSRTQAVIRYFG